MGDLLKRLIIAGLRRAAQKTETEIDDRLVDMVEMAMNSEAFINGIRDLLKVSEISEEDKAKIEQLLTAE